MSSGIPADYLILASKRWNPVIPEGRMSREATLYEDCLRDHPRISIIIHNHMRCLSVWVWDEARDGVCR